MRANNFGEKSKARKGKLAAVVNNSQRRNFAVSASERYFLANISLDWA